MTLLRRRRLSGRLRAFKSVDDDEPFGPPGWRPGLPNIVRFVCGDHAGTVVAADLVDPGEGGFTGPGLGGNGLLRELVHKAFRGTEAQPAGIEPKNGLHA